jgi:hypothetical protein
LARVESVVLGERGADIHAELATDDCRDAELRQHLEPRGDFVRQQSGELGRARPQQQRRP